MTNAPPCTTCGSPLRWYPDHYGWGCDRCRQFHPAPRPAAAVPPQRATPLPVALVPAPGAFQPINVGRKRSPLPLLIGVGGIAVIAIGIAVILKVSGGKRGGAKTRQDVIEQTFAALEAGDSDKLLALEDNGVLFTRVMDCDRRDDDEEDDRRERRKRRGDDADDDDFDFRDPEKVAERALREAKRTAAIHKGVRIEVLDVLTREPPKLDDKHVDDDEEDDRDRRRRDRDRDDRKTGDRERDRDRDRRASDRDDDDHDRDRDLGVTTTRKGKKVVKGCYAKTTFRMQRVKVRVRVTEDDREPDTQKVELNVVELEGRYYLSNNPEIKLHNSYGRHLNVMRDEMCECTDGKCASKLDREWKRYSRFGLREAKDRLKKDELKALEPVEKEVKECRKRAGGKADSSDDTVTKMMEVTEKMCACKDKACSEKVQEEFTRWGTDLAKKGGDREDTDPEVQKKITDVMTKYSECMMKLYSSDLSTGLEAAPPGMPYVCSEQRDITTKLMSCSGVTSTRKSMFKDDWERLARRWRDGDSSERIEIESQCRSTTDLLRRQQSTYSCY